MTYVASVHYTDHRGKGIRYGYRDTPDAALADLNKEMSVWKATPTSKPHICTKIQD